MQVHNDGKLPPLSQMFGSFRTNLIYMFYRSGRHTAKIARERGQTKEVFRDDSQLIVRFANTVVWKGTKLIFKRPRYQ